jgi:hypothetical protein
MVSRKKREPLCGYKYKYLAKNDKYFHWSKAYSWYLGLVVEEKHSNHLWMTGLVKSSCMPEVFKCSIVSSLVFQMI